MSRALIIFTRVPVPLQTKTRLMPYLSGQMCARLHTCFLKDIAGECGKVSADAFVYYTPEDKKGILREIFGRECVYRKQCEGNLGLRMYRAMKEVLAQGYDSCVLIGTDIPELTSKEIQYAFRLLDIHDIVFGPTKDGGYYLVGMKEPVKEVFAQQTYGHGSVLEQTVSYVRENRENACSVGYVRTICDVDTKEDVAELRNRLREKKSWQCSETGRFLMRNQTVSVIVPVYNEASTIEKIQRELLPLKDRCEILFVDGGSTDGTPDMIDSRFRVLYEVKGRAAQMNLGARESSGDILFFLHSDSELPKRPLEEIRAVMAGHRVGCFGIAFHSRSFFLWTCRVISNHRIKDRKVMFGDQGIFIDRALFFEAGMYPELPIMEDYQLSLTLKEMGVKIGIAKHRIYTSDRRFPKKTIPKLKVMWKMNRLRKMYRDGVSIGKISNLYKDVR